MPASSSSAAAIRIPIEIQVRTSFCSHVHRLCTQVTHRSACSPPHLPRTLYACPATLLVPSPVPPLRVVPTRRSGGGGVGARELVRRAREARRDQPVAPDLVEVALRRRLVAAELVPDLLAALAVDVGHFHQPLREVLLVPAPGQEAGSGERRGVGKYGSSTLVGLNGALRTSRRRRKHPSPASS